MPKLLPAPNMRATDGMSLLEVILSIAIISISITALVIISNASIRGVDSSRSQTLADQYVREGVEQIRSYRDNNGWNSLITGLTAGSASEKYYTLNNGTLTAQGQGAVSNPCSFANTATYAIPNANRYFRVIGMKLNSSSNEASITVYVCYNYKGTNFNSDKAQTILTNWR